MEESDADCVARLEMNIFPDPWSEKSILESLSQEYSICLVLEDRDQVVGYLIFYQSFGEGEILRVAVEKKNQRQGAGTCLLDALDTFCVEKGITKVMLDVRESNQKARNFYKKKGFEEDGIRRNFYTSPNEDAVLMSRRC